MNEAEKKIIDEIADKMAYSIEDVVELLYNQGKDEHSFYIALFSYIENLLKYSHEYVMEKRIKK